MTEVYVVKSNHRTIYTNRKYSAWAVYLFLSFATALCPCQTFILMRKTGGLAELVASYRTTKQKCIFVWYAPFICLLVYVLYTII